MPRSQRKKGTPKPADTARSKRTQSARTSRPIQRPASGQKTHEANGQFAKGNPGKPKGATDIVPRGVKASFKQLAQEILETRSLTLRNAIMRGIRGSSRDADRYLRLIAEYNEGKPESSVKLGMEFKTETMEEAAHQFRRSMSHMVKQLLSRREEKD